MEMGARTAEKILPETYAFDNNLIVCNGLVLRQFVSNPIKCDKLKMGKLFAFSLPLPMAISNGRIISVDCTSKNSLETQKVKWQSSSSPWWFIVGLPWKWNVLASWRQMKWKCHRWDNRAESLESTKSGDSFLHLDGNGYASATLCRPRPPFTWLFTFLHLFLGF